MIHGLLRRLRKQVFTAITAAAKKNLRPSARGLDRQIPAVPNKEDRQSSSVHYRCGS
jgi:hypothetical protein